MRAQPAASPIEALRELWQSLPPGERAGLGIHTREYFCRRNKCRMIELRWKLPAKGQAGSLGDVRERDWITAAAAMLQLLADLRAADERRKKHANPEAAAATGSRTAAA